MTLTGQNLLCLSVVSTCACLNEDCSVLCSAPPRHASGLAGSLRKLAEMTPPARLSEEATESQSLASAPSASSKHLPPRKGAGSPQPSSANLGAKVQAPTVATGARSAALPGDDGRGLRDVSGTASPEPPETDDDLIDRVAAAAAAPEAADGELFFPQQEYREAAPGEHSVNLLLSGGLGQHYTGAALEDDGLGPLEGSSGTQQSGESRGRVEAQQPLHSLGLSRVSSAASAGDSWLDGKHLLEAVTTSSRTDWKPSYR